MGGKLISRVVALSGRYAGILVLGILLIAIAAGYYTAGHFAMNSQTESLISPSTQWRARALVYDTAFPQGNGAIDVVVDGATPERALEVAQSLETALSKQKDILLNVRLPTVNPFFRHDGLMLLSTSEVQDTTAQMIAAQPFLGALAVDPSLRGIADALSTALLGVAHGQTKLADLDKPIGSFSQTLECVLAGKSCFLSWRALVTGRKPGVRETEIFIEIKPKLDYDALEPGLKATDAIRATIARLGFYKPDAGATVRITGVIPMEDDQFSSLTDRAGLMATLMMLAVLAMLWLAVRSARLIFAILLAVFSGLTITMAVGLMAIGAFNPISVAFIALFVGLGVDFGIQFCVRYRAERFERGSLDAALEHTGEKVGGALALAAAATAAGFYSFLPTNYRGVAELGFVAGTGMLIMFVLSVTFLPALVKLLSPPGEPEKVGFALLAPLDAPLRAHKRVVLIAAAVLGAFALSLLTKLEFDFNPLDLRDHHKESVATALQLMANPETSPNNVNVLEPTRAAADKMADTLSRLPEVAQVLSLDTFIPKDQTQKLALINDAHDLLDSTLNPFMTKPPPSDAEVVASLKLAAAALRQAAAQDHGKAGHDAATLAQAFDRLATANPAVRRRAETALIPGLNTMLDQLRDTLTPFPVTEQTLPKDVVRDWVSASGLYRIQVFPKPAYNRTENLRLFTQAVQRVAPDATGEPIGIQETGRTIVRAFMQAGFLSFAAIAIILFIALGRLSLVALSLGPLVLSGVVALATCVVIGLSLNYANIIALPLLFGIGVAFDIYFVMAWRAGERNLLGSPLARAVILSAGTTASAFGTLWISNDPGTSSMGELLAISLGWILVAVLFLMPALMAFAVPNLGLPQPTAPMRKS